MPVRFGVICAAVLFSAAAVRGQTEDVLPTSGMESLNAEHKKHHDLANDLLRGFRVADPKDQAHVEALDMQAKYDTYRFTWVPVQQKPGDIAKVYQGGVVTAVGYLTKGKPGTVGAISIYAPKVIEHALEVLKSQRLVARVNAARVLAKLAELGPPELAEALAGVLQDPNQSDAVKFHIAHALQILQEQNPPAVPPDQEKKAAEALANFIDRKMTIADTTKREEVEGFRYVRREGIRALAQFRNPGAAPRGQGALTLLRVVAKDGLMPPPRLDERVDAACGVARLKPSLNTEYNPDYAIAQIGLFLEEFNRESIAAREQLQESKGLSRFPWRIMASELYDAIDQMRVECADNAYVETAAKASLKLLAQLEKGNPADPEEILVVVGTPPPSKRLFKNVEDSTVRPANRRDNQDALLPAPPQLETKPSAPPGAPADGKPASPPGDKGKAPPSPFAPSEKAGKPAVPFPVQKPDK
jgi:hypothetical protein